MWSGYFSGKLENKGNAATDLSIPSPKHHFIIFKDKLFANHLLHLTFLKEIGSA